MQKFKEMHDIPMWRIVVTASQHLFFLRLAVLLTRAAINHSDQSIPSFPIFRCPPIQGIKWALEISLANIKAGDPLKFF